MQCRVLITCLMRFAPTPYPCTPPDSPLPTFFRLLPLRYDPYIGAMTDMYAALSACKNSPMRLVPTPYPMHTSLFPFPHTFSRCSHTGMTPTSAR